MTAAQAMTGARFVRVGGLDFHVAISGLPGAPWLTCLHSLATDLHLWEPQRLAFERHFRVLRIDMRGHGRSAAGKAPCSIETLSADVVGIWDALGIARASVIGLSIGGIIGLELALAVPDRLDRLVAADCRSDAPPAFREMWRQRRALLDAEGMSGLAAATIESWFTSDTLGSRPNWLADVRAMILGTAPDAYRAATIVLEDLALAPRLGRIGVPVRYVVGAEDGVHPDAMAAMQEATPGASLVIIAGAGHLSNIERPAAFLAATLAFLKDDESHATPVRT